LADVWEEELATQNEEEMKEEVKIN